MNTCWVPKCETESTASPSNDMEAIASKDHFRNCLIICTKLKTLVYTLFMLLLMAITQLAESGALPHSF